MKLKTFISKYFFIIIIFCFLIIVKTTNTENENSQILFEDNYLTKTVMDNKELLIDTRLPKGLIDMVVKHFKAMNDGDIEAFQSTLVPEDGSDTNSEPYAMNTFKAYENTGIYIKKIQLVATAFSDTTSFSDESYFNQVVEVVIVNPKKNIDIIFLAIITNSSGYFGISRYMPKEQL